MPVGDGRPAAVLRHVVRPVQAVPDRQPVGVHDRHLRGARVRVLRTAENRVVEDRGRRPARHRERARVHVVRQVEPVQGQVGRRGRHAHVPLRAAGRPDADRAGRHQAAVGQAAAVDPRLPVPQAAQRQPGRADRVLQRRPVVRVRVAVRPRGHGPVSHDQPTRPLRHPRLVVRPVRGRPVRPVHGQPDGVRVRVRRRRRPIGHRQPGRGREAVERGGRPAAGPGGLHHAAGTRLGREARVPQHGQRAPVLGVHGRRGQGVGPAPGHVPVDVRRAHGGRGIQQQATVAVRRHALQLVRADHRVRGQRSRVVHDGRVHQTDGRRPGRVPAARRQVARDARRQDAVQRAVPGPDIRVRRRLVRVRVEPAHRPSDHQMVHGAHRGGVLRGPARRDHRRQLRPVRRSARHRRRERQCSHVGPQHRRVSEPTADPVRLPDIRSLLVAQ